MGPLYRDVAAMLERFGLHIDPRRLAGTLSPSERALVALIIALDRVNSGVNLLILDEVAASLPRDEAEPYLEKVMEIAGEGGRDPDHYPPAFRTSPPSQGMTILRDGRNVYGGPADAIGDDAIIAHMVGEEGEERAQAAPAHPHSPVTSRPSGDKA